MGTGWTSDRERDAQPGAGDHDDWLRLFSGYLHFNDVTLSSDHAEVAFDRLIDPAVDLHTALAWGDDHGAIGLVQ